MVRQASRCTQKIAGKAVEALPAIVGSVVGAILSLLGEVVVFFAEHTWVLIVFVAGLIGVWMMQNFSGKQARKKLYGATLVFHGLHLGFRGTGNSFPTRSVSYASVQIRHWAMTLERLIYKFQPQRENEPEQPRPQNVHYLALVV